MVVLAALAGALAAAADAQTSTFAIAFSGIYPTVAATNDGGFVVVWDDYAHGTLRGRRFDAARQPEPVFHVANVGGAYLGALQVAADPRGFTVVWSTYGFHLEEPTPTNVLASVRRFDRDGVPRNRPSELAPLGRTYLAPSVEVLPDGRSLVAWTRSPGRTAPDIFARWLEPDGAPLGARFRLIGSRSEATSAWVLGIRALHPGGFAVAWTDRVVGPPEDHRLHLQCLNQLGETLGQRTLTRGGTAPPGPPALIALGEGFLVVWGEPARGASPVQLVAQAFDATCRPIRPPRYLGPATATWLDAAMDGAGNLLVSTLAVAGAEYRTVGYLYDRQLRRVGGKLDLAPGYLIRGATAAVAGGFVVAWTGKTSWPPGNLMGTFVPSPAEMP